MVDRDAVLPFAGSQLVAHELVLAARGESLTAFDGRCIPAGCVAPRSNTPGILGRRALPAGRLARLGATPDFHHGLLALCDEKSSHRRVARLYKELHHAEPEISARGGDGP